MALFITQGRFTQDAVKGMIAKPEDRAESVAKLFASAGAKLLSYYMTFGEYDFLIVCEGPVDDAATLAVAAAASSGIKDLKTTLAFSSAHMKAAFGKAGAIAAKFKAAGAKA